MKELVTDLLEKEILTEEYAQKLQESLAAELEAVRAEVIEEQTVALTEEWKKERTRIIEALDGQVNEVLEAELSQLREDIEQFRDLELEYETRLVEERQKMKAALDEDLDKLAVLVEEFLELKINAEISELHESIEDVKRIKTGQKLFEAYLTEFEEHYAIETGVSGKSAKLKEELERVKAEAKQLKEELESKAKAEKIKELIEPLSEAQKPVMASILDRVPMDEVDRTYKRSLEVLMRRSVSDKKGGEKLTEGEEVATDDKGGKSFREIIEKRLSEGKLTTVTGDSGVNKLTETKEVTPAPSPEYAQLLELAGVANK